MNPYFILQALQKTVADVITIGMSMFRFVASPAQCEESQRPNGTKRNHSKST
jgi:hypothetical protein